MIGWLRSLPGPVKVTYEAGPTGFGLARALEAAGIDCVVAAPSRLLRPSGDRVKTDAKDALHLARLLAVGEVTAVAVPDEETEAARDLVRARDDVARRSGERPASGDPSVAAPGHRLLRRHAVDPAARELAAPHRSADRRCRRPTTPRWRRWPPTEGRRDRLDEAIAQLAAASRFTPVIDRLACLRGISTLTGFGLAVEIGDWHRLSRPPSAPIWAWCPASTPPGKAARSAG